MNIPVPADAANLPFRPCVGVVLANRAGRVFAGERIDTPGAWQMPQGGIDPGESPRDAALRELHEETGIPADLVRVEAQGPDLIRYDLPPHLLGKAWQGRYRGQEQTWFLMRYLGEDAQITLDTGHAEFARWRWMTPTELIAAIVPFKRQAYIAVMSAFEEKL